MDPRTNPSWSLTMALKPMVLCDLLQAASQLTLKKPIGGLFHFLVTRPSNRQGVEELGLKALACKKFEKSNVALCVN